MGLRCECNERSRHRDLSGVGFASGVIAAASGQMGLERPVGINIVRLAPEDRVGSSVISGRRTEIACDSCSSRGPMAGEVRGRYRFSDLSKKRLLRLVTRLIRKRIGDIFDTGILCPWSSRDSFVDLDGRIERVKLRYIQLIVEHRISRDRFSEAAEHGHYNYSLCPARIHLRATGNSGPAVCCLSLCLRFRGRVEWLDDRLVPVAPKIGLRVSDARGRRINREKAKSAGRLIDITENNDAGFCRSCPAFRRGKGHAAKCFGLGGRR